jgi:hypothetical protein
MKKRYISTMGIKIKLPQILMKMNITMIMMEVKEDAKATEKKATNARVIARIRLLVGGNEGKEDCSRS